jgi:NAD(P)-dependent dehydrogenase (short-subunit alcohol dehydrogenase family)
MGKLDGKVALVTGAGRGHAEAVAKLFVKEGAALSICDIMPLAELDQRVGAPLRAAGGKVLCFHTDVSQEDQVNTWVRETIKALGTIDVLVNAVGVAGPTKDVWDVTLNEWKHTLVVNLDSMFLCAKAVLPVMMRKQWGRILNFSSTTGKTPLAHRTPYATSKMGVIGFTRTLAADVGRFNITVNAVCPGWSGERNVELAKAMAEYMGRPFDVAAYHERFEERLRKGVLAGRWLTGEGYMDKGSGPDEAALLCLFLASEDGGILTGQDINVGGYCMW